MNHNTFVNLIHLSIPSESLLVKIYNIYLLNRHNVITTKSF